MTGASHLQADIRRSAGKKFIASYKHGVYGTFAMWTMEEVDLKELEKIIRHRLD